MQQSRATPLSGLRILVVDDDEDVRELLVTMLEFSGAKVESASDCRAAVALCHSFAPDLLLSDMCMPGGGGTALLSLLHAPVQSVAPPRRPAAIAISAFVGPEHERSALAAGFQAFLTKPLDLSTLLSTLAQVGSTLPPR